jgi:hypothetical protein
LFEECICALHDENEINNDLEWGCSPGMDENMLRMDNETLQAERSATRSRGRACPLMIG